MRTRAANTVESAAAIASPCWPLARSHEHKTRHDTHVFRTHAYVRAHDAVTRGGIAVAQPPRSIQQASTGRQKRIAYMRLCVETDAKHGAREQCVNGLLTHTDTKIRAHHLSVSLATDSITHAGPHSSALLTIRMHF